MKLGIYFVFIKLLSNYKRRPAIWSSYITTPASLWWEACAFLKRGVPGGCRFDGLKRDFWPYRMSLK